ncbi:MAG: Sec-independent protein translocase protein TatB, partial [Betaproteobacteria bacterium]|nr:Sec-independent protein translocase protein TatB [Betaproteobacteria bacterium]
IRVLPVAIQATHPMFDIGFSELMVIAVVALIVIGPERLPRVARAAGHLFGRMQRYVNDVKSDISREMALDDLRKLQASMQDAAKSIEQSVTQEVRSAETEMNKISSDAQAALNEADKPAGEIAASADKPASADGGKPA